MEMEEKFIVEKAPLDSSTYFEGEPAAKEEGQDAGGIGTFPFVNTVMEAGLNE